MAHSDTQGVDVVGLGDVFSLIDVEPNDFSSPSRSAKLQDISAYFSGKPNPSRDVLRILSKDRRSDKVDAVWLWVKLQKDKEAALQKLNPDDFTDDIAQELKNGFLSREKLQELRKQIASEKARAEKMKAMREQRREASAAFQQKKREAVDRAFNEGHLERTDDVLAELEAIQRELQPYDD